MTRNLQIENEKEKMDLPFWKLICFVMFCIWQMGFIYFCGPSLSIDGRVPLPISMDNITLLIVAAYVCSIIIMMLLPRRVILFSRISCVIALLTALSWFMPLSASVLTGLIYVHCFSCCFMIGFETATIVYYFSEKSTVMHLFAAYPVSYAAIAVLQNDFVKFEFSVFRFFTVAMLILLSVFYFTMPCNAALHFAKKEDALLFPKKLFTGVYLLAFLGSILGVVGPAVAAQTPHGVSLLYIGCVVFAVSVFVIYKVKGRHPLHLLVFVIIFAAIGYLLYFVSLFVPQLALPACFLMGAGMTVCSLAPLYGVVLRRQYPSRFIAPVIIALAMVAVIVHSVIVEIFRDAPLFLNLAYLFLVIVMALLYLPLEPMLLYTLKRDFAETAGEREDVCIAQTAEDETAQAEQPTVRAPLAVLTNREREVVDLLGMGCTNADIAKRLFISEHTVKDHVKNIYRKLDVHNRIELITMVNRMLQEQ